MSQTCHYRPTQRQALSLFSTPCYFGSASERGFCDFWLGFDFWVGFCTGAIWRGFFVTVKDATGA